MDWSNERYVRLYIRDTPTWLRLRWEGQVLFSLMIRKCDRSGLFDDIIDPVDDLSLITGIPPEHVKVGYDRLIKYEVIEFRGNSILIPNFMEAQEAIKSDAQRQRDSREKRRLEAQSKPVTIRDEQRDESVTIRDEKSRPVTPSHAESRSVTPSRTVPDCTNPSRTVLKEKRAPARKGVPQKPTESMSTVALDESFEHFWKNQWPGKKVDKKKSRAEWIKAWRRKTLPNRAVMGLLIDKQKEARAALEANGEFVADWKHPHRWIRDDNWNDEYPAPSRPKPQHKQTQHERNVAILKAQREKRESEAREAEKQPPVKVAGKVEVVR
jgi:hypothetical protein